MNFGLAIGLVLVLVGLSSYKVSTDRPHKWGLTISFECLYSMKYNVGKCVSGNYVICYHHEFQLFCQYETVAANVTEAHSHNYILNNGFITKGSSQKLL